MQIWSELAIGRIDEETGTKAKNSTKPHVIEFQGSERRNAMSKGKTSTDHLEELATTRGIQTVAVVGRDGYVIETAGDTYATDMEALGATVSLMIDAADSTGSDLEIQPFNQMNIEYQGAVLSIMPVADALAVIVSPDEKSLGMVRFKMKKAIPQLAKFF